jgi:hypothetical protein
MRSDDFWTYFDSHRKLLDHRANSFAKVFEYLDGFDRPVTIVETGCTRNPTDIGWTGDGCSTILFDRYAQLHPQSIVRSVNIDHESVVQCRGFVSDCTEIHADDSVHFLATGAGGSGIIDLLYLDSYDVVLDTPDPAAAHCLKEFAAAAPLLRERTLVVVDDCPMVFYAIILRGMELRSISEPVITGKGKFIAEYAKQVGADMLFQDYQCGWKRMVRS